MDLLENSSSPLAEVKRLSGFINHDLNKTIHFEQGANAIAKTKSETHGQDKCSKTNYVFTQQFFKIFPQIIKKRNLDSLLQKFCRKVQNLMRMKCPQQ
ncbi:unnamed protein product [Leptidea sinapis]|uniref:Uncharacterized protein n=1 Tax=Leptidea sinapis TaxID=189913 RepID=A0A5E4Q915_9NEOP|nr:unnamed protein product [Leptidea sinapis]